MEEKDSLFKGFNILGNSFQDTNEDDLPSNDEIIGDSKKETKVVKLTEPVKKDESKSKDSDKKLSDDFKGSDEDVDKILDTEEEEGETLVDTNPPSENEEEEEEETNDDDSLKPFVEHLTSKGILEPLEDFDGSEEGLEKVVEQTVSKRLNEWKSSYGEEVNKFIEFVENGGDPKQFLDYFYSSNSWSDFDISDDEDAQKHVIKESLRIAGWEDDEIEAEINDYDDLGKLEQKASQHLKKMQKYEADVKEQMVEQQKAAKIKQQEDSKKYYESLRKEWFEKDNLNGFALNKSTKDKLWDFIYTPDKKTGKTKLQESYAANKDSQFMYAYLAMNNFDISKLEKQVETKTVSKLKQQLNRYTDSRSKLSSGRTEVGSKTGSSGFDGFKTIGK